MLYKSIKFLQVFMTNYDEDYEKMQTPPGSGPNLLNMLDNFCFPLRVILFS